MDKIFYLKSKKDNQIGSTGASDLGSALANCSNLQNLELYLWSNQIDSNGASGLGSALKNCTNLSNLNISLKNNQISGNGAQLLGSALGDCTNLSNLTLELNNNQIGDEGASAICSALKNSTNLSNLTLYLESNQIGANSASGLGSALINCTCLCLPGYFMDNTGNCQNCANNCLQCYNPQTCNKCVINYVLSSDYKSCICTIPNCQKCNKDDGSICDTCVDGFSSQYNNKICQCNSQNCLTCDPSNGNICQKCQQNYNLNKNSQCECSVQNCSKCNQKDGAICDSCVNGYISLDNNKKCQCGVQNCQQCDPNNGSICQKCQTNYILNTNKNECTCSVPYCQTCNANDGSICDTCQEGFVYSSTNQLCVVQQKNDFNVKQTVVENVGYNITISFQSQVVMTSQDPNSIFSVQIEDYDNPFKVNYIGMQQTNVFLQVNMENNCKNKHLILNMNDPLFVDVNNLKQPQKQVKLSDYVVLTQSQIQQAEDTKQVASKTSIFLYIITLLMTILGNSYVLFSTIDLTTFIYFMLFFHVRYPENVLSFCSIFQNFQFAFVPNTIQLYLLEPDYQQPYTPEKFIENGYDAQYYLQKKFIKLNFSFLIKIFKLKIDISLMELANLSLLLQALHLYIL
ncbi:hypothetical protein ABPG73_006761 [Tetrahymena malaccensis]